jgi:hypothetical protein
MEGSIRALRISYFSHLYFNKQNREVISSKDDLQNSLFLLQIYRHKYRTYSRFVTSIDFFLLH